MKASVSYIFRHPDVKYKSIEGVFLNLKKVVARKIDTSIIELNYSGGGLNTIWSNLKTFKKKQNVIYHITGDVHYMALVTGKSTVLTIHDVGSALSSNLIKRLYIKFLWFWLPALFVERITVISAFTKQELSTIIPFAKHKIKVIHNPLDSQFNFSAYQFNASKPKILLMGTKANKNIELILEAIKDLVCEVSIIGQLTDNQKKMLQTHKTAYSNAFNISLEDIIDAYKSCDLICFASTYEGFGMPIIEAQAVGRPVVTSNLGAMKEVANDTACLVDPYDVNSIREGVLKVCRDAIYREALIKKGIKNIERFQPEKIAQDYIEVYEELSQLK